MMDVREKLVEEQVELCGVICYAIRDWDDYMDECRETETPPIDSLEDFIADGVISAGYRKQEWISVKDRLPEKDGCYIVTACDEGCSCGDGIWYDTVVIEAEHYKGEWSWNENGTEYDITDFVTHWMPLPQPPKGE